MLGGMRLRISAAKASILAGAATLLVGLTFVALPAGAATTPGVPDYLLSQVSACQADVAVATTLDDKAWAARCLSLAQRAVTAWQHAHPTPSAPPSATHTTPPASPTATPTVTATPPAPASFTHGPAGGVGPLVTPTHMTSSIVSGTTYDGYTISAPGQITASNIVLRNCVLNGGPVFSGDHVTIDGCTIHGGISFSGSDHVILNRVEIDQWHGDALHITSDSGPTNDVSVQNSWLHNPGPLDCADHADGVQLLGGAGSLFAGDVIDLGAWQSCGSDPGDGPLNGAFQVQTETNTGAVVNGLTIIDTLVDGGGNILRVYNASTDVHVVRVGFGNHEQFGPADTLSCTGTVEWRDNYDAATLATVPRG